MGALDGNDARLFLACLSWELTLGARSKYGPEGTMTPGSEPELRSFNELLHRTSSQLCHAVGVGHEGYPPDAFLAVLEAEATRSSLLAELEYAITRALGTIGVA
jgi:hypothetical protein